MRPMINEHSNSQHHNQYRSLSSVTLPSKIHQTQDNRQNHFNKENEMCTIFAQDFQILQNNIQKIYPNIVRETGGPLLLDQNLSQIDGQLSAIQVYNHFSYMYQMAKDSILKEIRDRSRSKEGSPQQKIQMHIQAEETLNSQLDTAQKESEYFKRQVEVFKEQLQISSLREQDIQMRYEQRIQFLSDECKGYEQRIDQMQTQLNQFEKEDQDRQLNINTRPSLQGNDGNISFRVKQERQQFIASDFQSPDVTLKCKQTLELDNNTSKYCQLQELMKEKEAIIMNNTRQIKQIQTELAEAVSRLRLQDEMVEFEKQSNASLNSKILQLKTSYDNQLAMASQETSQNRKQVEAKEKLILDLNDQIDQLSRAINLEFPIMADPDEVTPLENSKSPTLRLAGQVSLVNQKQAKFAAESGYESSVLEEMHGGKLPKSNFMPKQLRKGEPTPNCKRGLRSVALGKSLNSMLHTHGLLKSNISCTQICDQILLEHKQLRKEKLAHLDNQLLVYREIEDKMQRIDAEKKESGNRQVELTKQNEDLKVKFSQLLDQFQEYVNETERRMEEDSQMQKDQQEKILSELNGNIKELEEMSHNLQNDCHDKDSQIFMLADEKQQLAKDLEALREVNAQRDEHQEAMQSVKIQSLNEEINYLKKHYLIEMDALRQENKNLRQRYRDKSNQALVDDRQAFSESKPAVREQRQAHSPYQVTMGDENPHNGISPNIQNHNSMLMGRQIQSFEQCSEAEAPSRIMNHADGNMSWHTPCQVEQLGDLRVMNKNQHYLPDQAEGTETTTRGSRQAMQPACQANQTQTYGVSRGRPSHFIGELQNDCGMRSKSYDRPTRPQYRNEQEWNPNGNQGSAQDYAELEQTDGLRYSVEDPSLSCHKQQSDYAGVQRAKNIISSTKTTFETLKREVQDKNRLIDQKNREIVKLRLENDEFKADLQQDYNPGPLSQQLRNQIVNEFDFATEGLKIELERTKINLFNNGMTQNPQMMSSMKDLSSQFIINTEQKFVNMVSERIQKLRGLTALASEVFLLTNQHKYKNASIPTNKEPDTSSVQLQRTIYKYENTLAQLDQILRNQSSMTASESNGVLDVKDQIIFELKKLTENQLKQIISLQTELDQCKGSDFSGMQYMGDQYQDNRTLKQEILMLREQAARNEQLQDGNDELVNDRRSLLLKIQQLEQMNQQSQTGLQDAQVQVKEKEDKLEDLRSRITVVAEVFEKKPIKQRYSFEVLCDFINDKAKRMLSKYDSAIKEKKQLVEDKQFYYQKRIKFVENDNKSLKDIVILLRKSIVPKLVQIANKQVHSTEIERLSETFLLELTDDLENVFEKFKMDQVNSVNKNLMQQKRIQDLEMIIQNQSNGYDVNQFGNEISNLDYDARINICQNN